MAHIFRKKSKIKIPLTAEISVKDGKRYATWKKRTGEVVTAEVLPDGKVHVESTNYYIEYTDHNGETQYETAFRTKRASEKLLLEITTRVEKIKSGDISPSAARRANYSLFELILKWQQSIIDQNRTVDHAKLYAGRVERVLEAAGICRVIEIDSSRISKALNAMRNRTDKPISQQTSNHYLTAAKAFSSWLNVQGYTERDCLASVDPITVTEMKTRRRVLSPEVFRKFVESVEVSRRVLFGLAGPDRAILYQLAAYTGLRRKELASLTHESFVFGDSPHIVVHAKNSKNRKAVMQPIPQAIVPLVEEYIAMQAPHRRLFNLRSHTNYMIKVDLKDACIPFEDEQGRQFDFHALRSQYGTMLARAGIPIQHAQKLMRHSTPKLTMNLYTHLSQDELQAQADKLS